MLLLSASGAWACGGNEMTVFPAGLTPIDPVDLATLPAATAADPHPETISFVSGMTTDQPENYAWVHGRGYVHASVANAWLALQSPPVCVDRRKVSSWSVTNNVETGYDVSFAIHNTVNSTITVMFDITWRQSAVNGTASNPNVVAASFQKTNGTTYIDLLAGTVLLTRIDDQTTEIDVEEHLAALGSGPDVAQSYLTDLYNSLVAQVHGQPLPTY